MESGAAKPQTQPPLAAQGRADLRATTQPDPSEASGQPQNSILRNKKTSSKAGRGLRFCCLAAPFLPALNQARAPSDGLFLLAAIEEESRSAKGQAQAEEEQQNAGPRPTVI